MNDLALKIQALWNYVQGLLDVRGDVVMLAMSAVFILRVLVSMFPKFPPLTASEAAVYGSAIGSFAWSNKGPKS